VGLEECADALAHQHVVVDYDEADRVTAHAELLIIGLAASRSANVGAIGSTPQWRS
jgi:hypothetical protein